MGESISGNPTRKKDWNPLHPPKVFKFQWSFLQRNGNSLFTYNGKEGSMQNSIVRVDSRLLDQIQTQSSWIDKKTPSLFFNLKGEKEKQREEEETDFRFFNGLEVSREHFWRQLPREKEREGEIDGWMWGPHSCTLTVGSQPLPLDGWAQISVWSDG